MHAERENQRLKTLLLPLKIHASLTQSAFISFFGCMSGLLEETSIVERYVKRWNRCALPALEELFIWSIMEEFSTTEEIVDAIREWSEADSFDERFNIIRLKRLFQLPVIIKRKKHKNLKNFIMLLYMKHLRYRTIGKPERKVADLQVQILLFRFRCSGENPLCF